MNDKAVRPTADPELAREPMPGDNYWSPDRTRRVEVVTVGRMIFVAEYRAEDDEPYREYEIHPDELRARVAASNVIFVPTTNPQRTLWSSTTLTKIDRAVPTYVGWNHEVVKTIPRFCFDELIGRRPVLPSLRDRIHKAGQYVADQARRGNWGFDSAVWVYFARAEMVNRIKIGMAEYVGRRERQLQGQSPVAIEIESTFKATRHHERALHHAFADLRVRGEWFSSHPDLEDLMVIIGDHDMDEREST